MRRFVNCRYCGKIMTIHIHDPHVPDVCKCYEERTYKGGFKIHQLWQWVGFWKNPVIDMMIHEDQTELELKEDNDADKTK